MSRSSSSDSDHPPFAVPAPHNHYHPQQGYHYPHPQPHYQLPYQQPVIKYKVKKYKHKKHGGHSSDSD